MMEIWNHCEQCGEQPKPPYATDCTVISIGGFQRNWHLCDQCRLSLVVVLRLWRGEVRDETK